MFTFQLCFDSQVPCIVDCTTTIKIYQSESGFTYRTHTHTHTHTQTYSIWSVPVLLAVLPFSCRMETNIFSPLEVCDHSEWIVSSILSVNFTNEIRSSRAETRPATYARFQSVFHVSVVRRRVFMLLCVGSWQLSLLTQSGCFSEGFAPFHGVIASLWWRRGPLLHAALSHDSCNIYMFTLTISICCFWNNQRPAGARREALL